VQRCGRFKRYRKKVQIEDIYPHQTYMIDPKFRWTPLIYELLIHLGTWNESAWDLFGCVNKYPLVCMNWNYLRQSTFI